MSTLGSLVVTLEANIAKFQSDLGKAIEVADQAMNRISKSVSMIKTAFGGLIGIFTVGGIAAFADSLIKSAAHLVELRSETGLSVTALSALSNEAMNLGENVDDVTSAFDKLEKFATAAVSGNKGATGWFNAIGISVKQLKDDLKDPDKLLIDVATALEGFNDGGTKTAAMMALFGKGGAKFTEILHSIATDGLKAATTTEAMAESARLAEVQLNQFGTWFKAQGTDAILFWLAGAKKWSVEVTTLFSDTWSDLKLSATAFWDFFRHGSLGVETEIARINNMAVKGHNALLRKNAEATYITDVAGKGVELADTGAKKKDLTPPPAEDKTKRLKQALDSQLKVYEAAIKSEDALLKLENKQLDESYANGMLSLASYSEQKNRALDQNFTKTQADYAMEIAAAVKYYRTQKDAQDQEMALNKIRELSDAKLQDTLKHEDDLITLRKLESDSAKRLASDVTNIAVAYAQMNGDNETAVKLQNDMADGLLKQSLAANGLTDDLNKLLAVEERRRLTASKSAQDGITRAMITYQQGIQDVAKSTENITTKMFTGMEDALVTFVQTGKLSFKSLIDSMIADMIRMVIQQQIMGIFTSMIGGFLGGLGGGGAAVGGSASGSGGMGAWGGARAGGGPVSGGTSYVVGENGPEIFTPSVMGAITPNGGGGMGGVNYAPRIFIDARSDRDQVHKEVTGALQQSNRDLMARLMRYNPGLRA